MVCFPPPPQACRGAGPSAQKDRLAAAARETSAEAAARTVGGLGIRRDHRGPCALRSLDVAAYDRLSNLVALCRKSSRRFHLELGRHGGSHGRGNGGAHLYQLAWNAVRKPSVLPRLPEEVTVSVCSIRTSRPLQASHPRRRNFSLRKHCRR